MERCVRVEGVDKGGNILGEEESRDIKERKGRLGEGTCRRTHLENPTQPSMLSLSSEWKVNQRRE